MENRAAKDNVNCLATYGCFDVATLDDFDVAGVPDAGEPFATVRLAFVGFFDFEPAGLISMVNGSVEAAVPSPLCESTDSTTTELDRLATG